MSFVSYQNSVSSTSSTFSFYSDSNKCLSALRGRKEIQFHSYSNEHNKIFRVIHRKQITVNEAVVEMAQVLSNGHSNGL